MKKIVIIIFLVIVTLFVVRTMVLKKPSSEILYTINKEDLVETIQVSGTFNKTATDEEKALAYLNYQNALSALKTSQQNKLAADATMWTKQKTLLDAQNNVDYKNDNTTNIATKKDYTDLEKYSIDGALTQAQKDFLASETKYKEADIAIGAANAQVAVTKLVYDDTFIDEPVITADINEMYLPRISIGQKTKIVFDAFNNQTMMGFVKSIDTVGTVKGGIVTYEMKVSMDTVPPGIMANMTAIVTIETLRKNTIISVPNSAIITKNNKNYVERVMKQKKNLIEISTGVKGLVKTEVIKGLSEKDVIIANPND
jgi:hypothetical protein